MIRRLIGITLALSLLALPGLALSQEAGGKVKTKFYNFDEMLIDGAIKKPTGLVTDVRKAARFRRLLSMKKSFLPILEKTSKEKVLK